jgi:ribosomal protein L37AE/L43A
MAKNLGTIWVCRDCMLHHANGECGDCHDDDYGHDREPWSHLDGNETVTMDSVEHDDYSRSSCDGCGSYLHGERHSFTLWRESTYKVRRFFRDDPQKDFTVKSGLTLGEAQERCKNPETSSSTCTTTEGTDRTLLYGPWFDGYYEE